MHSSEIAKCLTWHQKKWRKCKTLFASGTENKDEELEGKNLLLDPWYVLVHGMGPYKVGQTK